LTALRGPLTLGAVNRARHRRGPARGAAPLPARIACAVLWAAVLLAPAPALSAGGEPEAGGEPAMVAEVIDGDTVALASGRLVRYIGIDAPEVRRREHGAWVLDPEPFARAALEENRRLVEGRPVRLRFDVERRDRFGRLLAYVYLGDLLVNEQLVREGLARARRYGRNTALAVRLEAAEREARTARRGLWAEAKAP
jgi:micrococcal nuclease